MGRIGMFVLISFAVWWTGGALFITVGVAREYWKEKRARGNNHTTQN